MNKNATGFILWAFLGVAACSKSPNPASFNSSVMVVYACNPPLSSAMNISVNGQFSVGMGFSPDPNYLGVELYGTSRDLVCAINDTVVGEVNQPVLPNKQYSYFIGGPASNPCRVFLYDPLPPKGTSMAQVRFVNMSSDTTVYNCSINGVVLASGLVYKHLSAYYSVSGNTMLVITFTDRSGLTPPVVADSVQLTRGGVYSIVLRGNYGAPSLNLEKVYYNPIITL